MHFRILTAVLTTLMTIGCAAGHDERQDTQEGKGSGESETTDVSFEMPGNLKDNEPIYVTSGNSVYECNQTADVNGSKKVKCRMSDGESGMSLHRQK